VISKFSKHNFNRTAIEKRLVEAKFMRYLYEQL